VQTASPCRNSDIMIHITPIPQFSVDFIGFNCQKICGDDILRKNLALCGTNIKLTQKDIH